MSQLELADGRAIAIEDRGVASGHPVLFLHGAPGSRLINPDPWETAAARIRLITFDRPGYGASSPLRAGIVPSIVDRADDAAAVLDHLSVRTATVVGWSAGGLVALALAARWPERVERVAVVATPTHEDDVTRLGDGERAMVDSLRPNLPTATAVVASMLASIAKDADAMLQLVGRGPADDAVRNEPVLGPRLRHMTTESVRQGVTGLAADIVASSVAPWGFDPAAVDVPVTLWYGEQDQLVPPVHGAWWAGILPEAELHVIPGTGHCLPLVAWKDILRR